MTTGIWDGTKAVAGGVTTVTTGIWDGTKAVSIFIITFCMLVVFSKIKTLVSDANKTKSTKEDQLALEAALEASKKESPMRYSQSKDTTRAGLGFSVRTPEELQRELLGRYESAEDQLALEAALEASKKESPIRHSQSKDTTGTGIGSIARTVQEIERGRWDIITRSPQEDELFRHIIEQSKLDGASASSSLQITTTPRVSHSMEHVIPKAKPSMQDKIKCKRVIEEYLDEMNYAKEQKDQAIKEVIESEEVSMIDSETVIMIVNQYWNQHYSDELDVSLSGDEGYLSE